MVCPRSDFKHVDGFVRICSRGEREKGDGILR